MAQIEQSVARYLQQFDTPTGRSRPRRSKPRRAPEREDREAEEEMQRLHAVEAQMLATPDQQISLTDPDARSMATSGRGSGVVATMSRSRSIPSIIDHHA